MHRESQINTQSDLFTDVAAYLPEPARKDFLDPYAWHNVFRREVLERVDEQVFSPLYSNRTGRPNASLRQLVGMLVLKEKSGWSDQELFEQCHFNLLVRSALGVFTMQDHVPSESTYYLFQQHLFAWQIESGEDLYNRCFQAVTRAQAIEYAVDGRVVRMDSTFVGHNIAWTNRTQLVLGVLREFYKTLSAAQKARIDTADRQVLEHWSSRRPTQITYPLQKDQIAALFGEAGQVMCRLVCLFADDQSAYYAVLERVYREQYDEVDGDVTGKPGEKISSSSVQSPHDVDAEYRWKNGEKVKGSAVNLTETLSESGLDLVNAVSVDGASVQDSDRFQEAIEQSRVVTGEVKEAITDGAYSSPSNRAYAEEHQMEHRVSTMPGPAGRYRFSVTDAGMEATDTQTSESQMVWASGTQFRITQPNGKYRYFTREQIETSILRQSIEVNAQEVRRRRANVEATIFQLVLHTRNDKTRYRGRHRNCLWAVSRVLWINLVRIRNHLLRTSPGKNPLSEMVFPGIIRPVFAMFSRLMAVPEYAL